MRHLVAIALLSCLTACSGKEETQEVPVVASADTVRMTAEGNVAGFVADNGTHVWRGLPYAASTAGENRWRAPRPAPSWDGTYEALEFGERCVQKTNRLNASEGIEPGLLIGSEDCLTLNIYAPADAAGKNLPVMLWIHGGANVWGRAASYDGSNLAANENVIIVTVQYRLGPLGWFAHEKIRETAETPADAAANFGTLDLIASLNWVGENIAEFGGNPENITIFGESAGGHDVVTLLASPLAAGLFHRAIVQSGSFDSISLAQAEEDDPRSANKIAAKLGVSTAAELRAIPAGDFLDAYWLEEGFIEAPLIIEDGVVLPSMPLREAFASTDTFNAVPIITGTNRDEMKFFYIADERLVKKLFGIFVVARDQDLYDAASDYSARLWRIRSVDGPAARMAAAGHDKVFAYRFDWDEGGRFLFMNFAKMFGAAHAVEIPFVFNRFRLLGDADKIMFAKKTAASRDTLSRAMGRYWASFAKTGAPSANGTADWPVYTTGGGSLIRFDSVNDGGIEIITGADDLDKILQDLAADQRADQKERCLIAESLYGWVPEIQDQVDQAFSCD